MSAIPTTTSIGKARWTQGEDGEASVEIRIPIVLPDGVRPRDLTVEIKDGEILCVSHEETRIIQWRLYAQVKDEVEWRVEDDKMVVDLEKKSPVVWSCLIDLPMKADDPLFTSLEEINRMFATQLPVLPSVGKVAGAEDDDVDEGKAEKKEKKEGEDDELDRLLDEVADEVVKKSEEEVTHDDFIKAELDNYKLEADEIMKKLTEVEAKLIDPTENETTNTAKEQKEVLTEMLRLHNLCRELRSKPSTLDNFMECTVLDLMKARVNIGVTSLEEEEEFQDEDEKSLNANELMACGLRLFENKDIKGCLHFLRLAAVHHKHDQSILMLYNIYSHLGSPRGTFLLLKRALDDEDPSAMANQKVGELYDSGARHFLPLFPAALYFFQRAAKLGSVNAMLSLAQLWLRGATDSTMLSEEQMEAQKSVSKYHAWLQKAIDRGCGSAYFVKGCMHIKGEHGVPRSYAQAKENLDAASSAQPEIIHRAPQIMQMLEAMRAEEEEETSASASAKTSSGAAAAGDGDEEVKVTPSMARLNALGKLSGSPSGSPAGTGSRTKRTFTASARRKAFWERACVTSAVVYGIYTLIFPLRIMMLPLFYSIMGPITDAIPWLGNGGAGGDVPLF